MGVKGRWGWKNECLSCVRKKVDVNKISDSDGATALHCAAAGGSPISVEVVKLLLEASADVNLADANGNKPGNLIARGIKSSNRKALEMLLKGFAIADGSDEEQIEEKEIVVAKKEYPVDVSMPDINNGVCGIDEFRMYTSKVKPCSRAYTHDWTECPFVHLGENARRRDLRKFNYNCVTCPEFRKGSCVKGDACEYAHGVFESWLHPSNINNNNNRFGELKPTNLDDVFGSLNQSLLSQFHGLSPNFNSNRLILDAFTV